jgi:hypothetical protein
MEDPHPSPLPQAGEGANQPRCSVARKASVNSANASSKCARFSINKGKRLKCSRCRVRCIGSISRPLLRSLHTADCTVASTSLTEIAPRLSFSAK